MNKQQLLQAFLRQLPASPSNTNKLFVIGMVGLHGSGKSYIAQKLGKEMGLYVGSNDEIRRFLNSQGLEGQAPAQEYVQYIAEESSKYLYQNKISHIIDADLIKFHENARRNAQEHGAEFVLIHITCPEPLIRKRIAQRAEEIANGTTANLSRAEVTEFEERLQIHQEATHPEYDFVIQSGEELEPQIEEFIQILRKRQLL